MRTRARFGLFLAVGVTVLACGEDGRVPLGPADHTAGVRSPSYQGVNLDVSGRMSAGDFDELADAGINGIALVPFGWQPRFDAPEVQLRTSGVRWSESDDGLREISAAARERGMSVMIKPHVWLWQEVTGEWRGSIRFDRDEDWQQWESDYRTLILHYAQLAADENVELFSVGVELNSAIRERPEFWRSLIDDVRHVFPGRITYGANWFQEFEDVGFWDLVDVIGVHAYFPLTDRSDASVEQLLSGWQQHLGDIRSLCLTHDKPIVFLEVGYRSVPGAAVEPWRYDESPSEDEQAETGLAEQAESYEALFRTFWHEPWFDGLFMWKWNVGVRDRDLYSPQGKPAETVLTEWFLGSGT